MPQILYNSYSRLHLFYFINSYSLNLNGLIDTTKYVFSKLNFLKIFNLGNVITSFGYSGMSAFLALKSISNLKSSIKASYSYSFDHKLLKKKCMKQLTAISTDQHIYIKLFK